MFDDGVLRFAGVMLTMALIGGGIYLMIILLNALQHKLPGGKAREGRAIEGQSQSLEAMLSGTAAELEAVVGGSPPSSMDVRQLRDRVAILEDLVADLADGRMADMEERLEFAERLLSSEENRARLPEPSDEVTSPSERGAGRG